LKTLCSGKVYYHLLESRLESEQDDVALIRIEQLYPFPNDALRDVLSLYKHVTDFVWVQEEPMNQGAWYSSQHRMRQVVESINGSAYLRYAGRSELSAPAAGYMSAHLDEQKQFIDATFDLNV